MTVPLHDDPLLTGIPEIDGFKVLEPCVLYSKLGEGGMGTVYRGRHLNLDIDVAVKCLRRSLADQGPSFVQRFQREARLAAGIHHQNLVQVYDVSQKGGVHYLVMEFVSGETARDRVRRKGQLKLNEALRIALGAAGGLAEAHARRIVHRDVKPDNVLIGRDGSVKVSDLGLAKAIEGEVSITLTQGVMGTPQYMAPEQWEDSSRVTTAADVWALGATIYFLLAGTDPIQVGTLQQVLRRICLEPFPDIRAVRPDVPAEVARLIERCVARPLDERLPDCAHVLAELGPLVARDQGELLSQPGETTQMGATLVSPPPPETLAKIRLRIDTKSGTSEEAPLRTEAYAAPSSRADAQPLSQRLRGKLGLALAGLAATIATLLFFALRGGDAREDSPGERGSSASNAATEPRDEHPATAVDVGVPPEPTPLRVSFDQVPDLGKGHASPLAAFALQGRVDGWNPSFAARIRGNQGRVDPVDLGDGRFRFDFRFERDGEYELELAGEHLAGPTRMPIAVDTQPPVLATRAGTLAGPYEPEAEVAFALEFDESLKSARIDGREARIEGRIARVTSVAPARGKSWNVPWRAVDRFDHESADSFVAKLEAPPAPTASVPALPAQARVPRDCLPLGEEALDLGGVRWAKRVQHASGIRLVLVPPDDFVMGSEVEADHAPRPRTVTIRRAFYMSENEVSAAEYAAVLRRPAPPADEGRLPQAKLSWADADAFCEKGKFRLPSEAEWEYACRAGTSTAYAFGPTLGPQQGATAESGFRPRPCGFSERNAFGLADMHGNVREYCRDKYLAPEEYAELAPVDPLGKKGKLRVLRGGSFASQPALCTSAGRQSVDEKKALDDAGLRVTLPLD